MAYYELNSEITVGKYRFYGCDHVTVKRGIHGYADYASFRLPSRAIIGGNNGTIPELVAVGSLLADGDKVEIKLGYNGRLRTEFKGFVKRRNLAMPLEVECEGYVRLLRLNSYKADLSKGIEVKELLNLVCGSIGVRVECPVSFKVYGRVLQEASGAQVLDEIMKVSDRALTIFFKEPDLLWCGLVYTQYLAGQRVFGLPTVAYRLGWNVPKDNGLRERTTKEPVQVMINGKLASGDAVRTESDNKVAARKVNFLWNGVHSEATMRSFANEIANHVNYSGYEGSITTFLEPFVEPGYDAYIVDSRYPERNGTYLVEAVETTYGINGARRRVDIGPKLK